MNPPDGTAITQIDPYLEPYVHRLRERYGHYKYVRANIEKIDPKGLLGDVSLGYTYFGFNRGELYGKPGVWYREWAPGALQLRLIGDFNDWDRWGNPLVRDAFGVWSLFLSDEQFGKKLIHGSKLKVHVVFEDSKSADRIPAYIRRAVQEDRGGHFVGQFWMPPEAYIFKHARPKLDGGLRIYEAHVGMSSEDYKVASYTDFARRMLPRIADLGYNAIQLMAVQEHPYYGSFGYHVSNFFAPSSRFGTPEELKGLIDTAHGHGLRVLLDVVHSHSVKNTNEGLNYFDGTDYQYFHAGPRGQHPGWDSKLFDYSKYEVQRFLLSNCRYWIEEFKFDGFRFDGVTSMLYHHHGMGQDFSSYDDYFGGNVDADAVAYLMLANQLLHTIDPGVTTIAEEVSGMVGMARPVDDGGIGFDYRLAMGVPDYWIKIAKEKADEDWSLSDIFHTLLNRRVGEKHIGYAESHDQALVGDKTLAFRFMDAEMYWHMDVNSHSIKIDRGVALLKLIRLVTFSLAGDGYLNFMGNEFGHPEWIDFPREGNNYSYHYCRRQWSLVESPHLRYAGLNRFDKALMSLDRTFNVLSDPFIEKLWEHEADKQLIFRRGPLVFVMNWHPHNSYTDWQIPVPDPVNYHLVLNSDSKTFAGHGSAADEMVYPWLKAPVAGRSQSVKIYVPARSVLVLAPVKPAAPNG